MCAHTYRIQSPDRFLDWHFWMPSLCIMTVISMLLAKASSITLLTARIEYKLYEQYRFAISSWILHEFKIDHDTPLYHTCMQWSYIMPILKDTATSKVIYMTFSILLKLLVTLDWHYSSVNRHFEQHLLLNSTWWQKKTVQKNFFWDISLVTKACHDIDIALSSFHPSLLYRYVKVVSCDQIKMAPWDLSERHFNHYFFLQKKRDSVQSWTHENWSLLDSSSATTMETAFDPATFLNDNQAAILQLQDLFGQDELDLGGGGDPSLYYDELTFGVYSNQFVVLEPKLTVQKIINSPRSYIHHGWYYWALSPN